MSQLKFTETHWSRLGESCSFASSSGRGVSVCLSVLQDIGLARLKLEEGKQELVGLGEVCPLLLRVTSSDVSVLSCAGCP